MPRHTRRGTTNNDSAVAAARKKTMKKTEASKKSGPTKGEKLTDDDDWANGWTLWTSFRAEKGHGDVPTTYPNKELVKWAERQQEDYTNWKEGQATFLSSDGFRMLTRMGFVWEYDKKAGSKKKTLCQTEPTQEQQQAALPIGGWKTSPTMDDAANDNDDNTQKNETKYFLTSRQLTQLSDAEEKESEADTETLVIDIINSQKTQQTQLIASGNETKEVLPSHPEPITESFRSASTNTEKPPTKSTPLKKRLARSPPSESEPTQKKANDGWDSYFQELLIHVSPQNSMDDIAPESELGKWVKDNRESYKLFLKDEPNVLTKERIDLLRSVNFDFSDRSATEVSSNPTAKLISQSLENAIEKAAVESLAIEAIVAASLTMGMEMKQDENDKKRKAEDDVSVSLTKKALAMNGASVPLDMGMEILTEKTEFTTIHEDSQNQKKSNLEKSSGPPKKRLGDHSVEPEDEAYLGISDLQMSLTPQAPSLYKKEMNTDPTPGPMEVDPSLLDKSSVLRKEKEFTEDEYKWLTTPGEPFEPFPEKRVSPLQAEYNRRWHKNFCELVEFKRLHGHTLIPKTYPPNKTLAMFVYRMRSEKRSLDRGDRTSLNAYRLGKLKAINFSWTSKGQPDFWKFKLDTKSALNDGWEEKFRQLVTYKQENGNVLVPKKYPKNQSLSSWVQRQRAMYRFRHLGKKNSMTDNRMQRLEELGFIWNSKLSKEHLRFANLRPHEDTFNKHYQNLLKFKEEHGHTWVPKEWKKDVQLARFVGKMRTTRRRMLGKGAGNEADEKTDLDTEVDFNLQIMKGRIKKLDEMGFIWNEEGAKSYEDWVRKSKRENTEIKSPGYNSGRKGGTDIKEEELETSTGAIAQAPAAGVSFVTTTNVSTNTAEISNNANVATAAEIVATTAAEAPQSQGEVIIENTKAEVVPNENVDCVEATIEVLTAATMTAEKVPPMEPIVEI